MEANKQSEEKLFYLSIIHQYQDILENILISYEDLTKENIKDLDFKKIIENSLERNNQLASLVIEKELKGSESK